MDEEDHPETVGELAPYVLAVLEHRRFFLHLDNDFWPPHSKAPQPCDHTFSRTKAVLRKLGMDDDDVSDVILVMMASGTCCDSEVLCNVANESRLKSAYWKSCAERQATDH